jgi:ABC-type nitrate/sulfonate/bicarbonate transport system substrate-binding protein
MGLLASRMTGGTRGRLATVMVFGMVLVVACGGSSPSAASTPATVLTHWGIPPAASVALPYLADKWGYFKAEGIAVDYFTQPSGVTLTQALLAGDIDFISSAIEIPMQTAEQGQQLRNVSGEDARPASAVMVPTGSSIQSVADLKGKKIGVAAIGSSQNTEVKVILSDAGVAASAVTFVPVGVGATAVAAFRAKQIDALDSSDPAIQVLTMSGEARILVDFRKGEGGSHVQAPSTAITASLAFIQKSPDVVHRVVRALARAAKRAHDHPDQVFTVFRGLDIFKALDDATLRDIANTVAPNFSATLNEAEIATANERALAGGTVKQTHAFADVVATQFAPDWKATY